MMPTGRFHRKATSPWQLGKPGADRAPPVTQAQLRRRPSGSNLQRVFGHIDSKIHWAWHERSSVVRYALPGWTPTDVSFYPNRRSADCSQRPLDSSSTLVVGWENSREVRPSTMADAKRRPSTPALSQYPPQGARQHHTSAARDLLFLSMQQQILRVAQDEKFPYFDCLTEKVCPAIV